MRCSKKLRSSTERIIHALKIDFFSIISQNVRVGLMGCIEVKGGKNDGTKISER